MQTDSLFLPAVSGLAGAGLGTGRAGSVGSGLRAEEVKQTGFRLDGVLASPDDQPEWTLMFIETQFQHDPDFHARWFSELFLYLYRRPPCRAWWAVALFPNRAVEGTVEVAFGTLLVNPWVKRVYLEEAPQALHRCGACGEDRLERGGSAGVAGGEELRPR